MATTTPNFGWPVPTSTDLVKDGATAMEALGDAIDTSMVDLKGGTTGQVLAKASNTDMDFSWVAQDDSNAIQNTIVDAKGDLIAASAADTPARLAVGNNGETLVADSSTSTGLRYQGSAPAGKNGVINSAFDVWQRGTSFASIAAYTYYTADRWIFNFGLLTTATLSRQLTNDTTNLPFIQYCARVQRNSGVTSTSAPSIAYSFENSDSNRYIGQAITFSFYARAGANFSAASNQLIVRVASGTGTDQSMGTGFTGQNDFIASGANLTTTWTRYTFTGTMPASAKQLGFYLYYGATGTAGAADFFEATGFQIELGSVATPFARNSGTIQGELAACQRYYYRANSTGYAYFCNSANFNTASALGTVNFPVVMRTAPTFGASAGNTFMVYQGSTVYAGTGAVSSDGTTQQTGGISVGVGSGLTLGYASNIRSNNTAAYLEYSAEL